MAQCKRQKKYLQVLYFDKGIYMQVLPIKNSNIINYHSSIKSDIAYKYAFGGKRVKTQAVQDVMELSNADQLFERIRLRTAKKLYETDFTLSGENWGEKSLSTFVLNRKKKGKPEELFIRAYKFPDGGERYEFYRPETKYCQKLVGACNINFYPEQKIVEPQYVSGNDKELRGIGFRCVQLLAERLLMKSYKNIVFKPDNIAYNFYIGAGYDVLKDDSTILPKCFYETAECVNGELSELIEHLLAKMPEPESSVQIPEDCFLFLPDASKKDWEKIIKKQPILIGKNLEEFFYKGYLK